MDRKFIGGGSNAGMPEQTFWLGRVVEARQEPGAEQGLKAEPRHSIRRPVNLDVLINHGLSFSVPSHVRNLSLTGALIEMDTASLPDGSYVEVVLRYRHRDEPVELRLPATVARIVAGGVALTFGSYDDDSYTHLANLLYAL